MQHPDIKYRPHIHQATLYKGGSTRAEAGESKILWKLSSNENLLGPSQLAVEAIRENIHLLHEYNFQDETCLTQSLVEYFEDRLLPDQFFVGNGGMELIQMICGAFINPGNKEEAIISSPTFMAYANFIKGAGASVVNVPLLEDDFALDIEGILKNINANTRLLFIASPNNPTGAIVSMNEMDILMKRLPPHVVVILDEVYHHFVQDPDYARAIHYINQGYPVIGIHSLSKAYGLAGMRLAYGYSTKELAEYLQKAGRPFKINSLATVAGIAALKDKEHIARTIKMVNQEKEWLYDQFTEMGLKCWRSHANFLLFNPINDIHEFEKRMQQAGVMVRKADVFLAPQCIRITIGTQEANVAFLNAAKKIWMRI